MDADPDATPPWLATAYIPGPTLHRAVADHGPLPAEAVAVLGAGLAEGLAAVYAQGVVHRDLKPGNVLLAEDGPRLIDFGIARALDATSHTHSSTVLGTAAFMSPEQAKAQKVGPASDVFSLGCVLAFAATGRSPFGDGPVYAVLFRVVHEEPDLGGLPVSLVDLVRGCLAKEPADRAGLEEVLAALASLSPSRGGDQGWLPPDVTEALARYTFAYTRVETEQVRPRDRGLTEPKKQRPEATASGTTGPETPTFWQKLRGAWGASAGRDEQRDSPAGADRAELVIGNLSLYPMEVVVDGTVLGTAPGFASRTFPVGPGTRSLLVRAEGRGATRIVHVAEGGAVRMAFDLPPETQSAPEPAEWVVFSVTRLQRAKTWALVAGGLSTLFVGLVMAASWSHSPSSETEMLLFAVTMVLFGGGGFGLMALFDEPPMQLVLNSETLTPPNRLGGEKPIKWSDFEGVSLVGHGRSARVVVWPRKGRPLKTAKTLKDYQGGKVVCRAGQIGAGGGFQEGRLRAALRWFAGEKWVEQPTDP
ncbi:protein kinase [Nocardiopsis sp. NPDC101807]|uniref:protein kinase domain-containing protein n=1 Tax=Nocardiopsis sp. NPDC101807 TaxID=3364339 RepID=UPI0037FC4C2D